MQQHALSPAWLAACPKYTIVRVYRAAKVRLTVSASSCFYRLLHVSELLFLPAVRNRTLSVADFRDLWRSLSERPCFSAAWCCNVAHFLSDAALLRADCLLPHVQPMPAASEASSVSVDLSAERLRCLHSSLVSSYLPRLARAHSCPRRLTSCESFKTPCAQQLL